MAIELYVGDIWPKYRNYWLSLPFTSLACSGAREETRAIVKESAGNSSGTQLATVRQFFGALDVNKKLGCFDRPARN